MGRTTQIHLIFLKPTELLKNLFADREKEQPRCSYNTDSSEMVGTVRWNAAATCETRWATQHTRNVFVHNSMGPIKLLDQQL